MAASTHSAAEPAQDLPFGGTPPIFVGGLPRSGTTLVARLLGSHSDVALPPGELGFFNVLWQPGDRPDRRIRDRAEFDRRLERMLQRIGAWGLSEHKLVEAAGVEPTFRDLFVLLIDTYRRSTRRPRAAEKSVYYHQWLYVLDAWFEDYRFVHVVRHPVDSFASVKWFKRGTPRPNKVDLIPWMHEWNESATVALHRSNARPDRYCLLRYEDVVTRPAESVEQICRVVGVAPEVERMLSMEDGESTESSFADAMDQADYDGRIRRSDTVNRSERIDGRELRAITSVCSSLANLLGYDIGQLQTRRGSIGQPATGMPPLRTAIAFAATRTAQRLRRRHRLR